MVEFPPSTRTIKCRAPTNPPLFRAPNSSQSPAPNTRACRRTCAHPRCRGPSPSTGRSQSSRYGQCGPAEYSPASNRDKSHPTSASDPTPTQPPPQISWLAPRRSAVSSSNGKRAHRHDNNPAQNRVSLRFEMRISNASKTDVATIARFCARHSCAPLDAWQSTPSFSKSSWQIFRHCPSCALASLCQTSRVQSPSKTQNRRASPSPCCR
mmetsp:Transcript_15773/g.24209  ORF Transcript_15773/g.24209 Transcript_15773/m.24209 type:complete len:210 (-) Transcript_15773:653-1282(-)